MPISLDIGGTAAAIVASISLLLTELRARRTAAGLTDEQIREALMTLETGLRDWSEWATVTNEVARAIATDATQLPSRARTYLIMESNAAIGMRVVQLFLGRRKGAIALKTLVRVFAPDLRDLTKLFATRLEAVRQMVSRGLDPYFEAEELGKDEWLSLLQPLEDTQGALEKAADDIAAVVRESFATS